MSRPDQAGTSRGHQTGRVVKALTLPCGLLLCLLVLWLSAPVAIGEEPADVFFDRVAAEARAIAEQPFQAPPPPPKALMEATQDPTRAAIFRMERTIWGDETGSAFRARFFHRGQWFQEPVEMVEIVDGVEKPFEYDPTLFDTQAAGLDPSTLPKDLGYAGMTLYFRGPGMNAFQEKFSFLGASYFRAVGVNHHWGSSGRGLSIDTAIEGKSEEFPRFQKYWLVRPRPEDTTMTVYAILNGPAVTGAYRFILKPGEKTTMDVKLALFFRHEVEKLGIAPMTSMFLFGEEEPGRVGDWRPEVHDADGLLIVTREGEHVWRPLDNPGWTRTSQMPYTNPIGFGLIQRDRDFRHYQDLQKEFERRPSVWVQTLGDWGRGHVELVEFHSGDEDFDNIAGYWVPDDSEKTQPGARYDLAYRLWFCDDEPPIPSAGRWMTTWRGFPEAMHPSRRNDKALRFVLEAKGGSLDTLAPERPEAVITAQNGTLLGTPAVVRNEAMGTWRVTFDVKPDAEPIELRAFLKHGENVLTETWLYRWDWGAP